MFAQRFLDRVEETFFNENKHHKFFELIQILRDFSELQEQSGAQLYMVGVFSIFYDMETLTISF